MPHSTSVPVLVAGGGPVGLVTALELQSRGIQTLLIERNPGTTQHPKMDVTNGRSMEHFRRLGIAERIRDAAVPRGNRMDVVWVTRLTEWELARFSYPDVHTWRGRIRAKNDGSQPLEPNMRLSQIVFEPVLRDILLTSPRVELRYGSALESFVQNEAGVTGDRAGRRERRHLRSAVRASRGLRRRGRHGARGSGNPLGGPVQHHSLLHGSLPFAGEGAAAFRNGLALPIPGWRHVDRPGR